MQQNVLTMNERSILDSVQRWRRTKYSARPFALTLLAIGLITLLAWAREQRGEAPSSGLPRKRDVTMPDEEVPHTTAYYRSTC